MQDESLHKRLENIADFISFEAGTSIIWPWAVPAEELLQRREELRAVAQTIRLDSDGRCDTDEMYEALERVFGPNPILVEGTHSEEGMVAPGM